jgi:hypothetical protein
MRLRPDVPAIRAASVADKAPTRRGRRLESGAALDSKSVPRMTATPPATGMRSSLTRASRMQQTVSPGCSSATVQDARESRSLCNACKRRGSREYASPEQSFYRLQGIRTGKNIERQSSTNAFGGRDAARRRSGASWQRRGIPSSYSAALRDLDRLGCRTLQ